MEKVNTEGIKCLMSLDLLPQKRASYRFAVTVKNYKIFIDINLCKIYKLP